MHSRNDGLDYHRTPEDVQLRRGQTSYFSTPETDLDPRLFHEHKMLPDVREELSGLVMGHLGRHYQQPEKWAKAWLAGSGASYQWSADRHPGDLDILVGVDYPQFRMTNDKYVRLGDDEIAEHINDSFRKHLTPTTTNWRDSFEVTFYNNPGSHDIRAIKPYAAYNLMSDDWDVHPDPTPYKPSFNPQVERDRQKALDILRRYKASRDALGRRDLDTPGRERHIAAMGESLQQASALFEDIHEGRSWAFRPGGLGYADPSNFRWQANKANGVVPALKMLHDFVNDNEAAQQIRQYGVVLPDVDSLILRSMVLADDR